MSRARPVVLFALRFALTLGVLLAPIPGLAGAYTELFGHAANAGLFIADHNATVSLRFEPPAAPAPDSWMAVLRVTDRASQQTGRMKLDARTFSYRPIAMYLALVAGIWPKDRRRLGRAAIGMIAMVALTTCLAALAALRFGLGPVVGIATGAFAETLYQALTTPTMLYAVPVMCFYIALLSAQSLTRAESTSGRIVPVS